MCLNCEDHTLVLTIIDKCEWCEAILPETGDVCANCHKVNDRKNPTPSKTYKEGIDPDDEHNEHNEFYHSLKTSLPEHIKHNLSTARFHQKRINDVFKEMEEVSPSSFTCNVCNRITVHILQGDNIVCVECGAEISLEGELSKKIKLQLVKSAVMEYLDKNKLSIEGTNLKSLLDQL
jgi:transcription elongation factor Elf1